MDTRQQEVQKIALLTSHLTSQLMQLSGKEKWYDVRVLEIVSTQAEIQARLNALGLTTVTVTPAPSPAQIHASTRPAPMAGVKFIRVGPHLSTSRGGAVFYETKGLIGGMITQQGRFMGTYRDNDKRGVPNSAVLVPRDSNGWVGVEANWYNKPAQQDLRDWVTLYKRD